MGRIWNAAAICAMTLALAACGGSSADDETDGSGTTPAPPPVLTTIAVTPSAAIVGVGLATTVTAEARDQNGAVMPGVAFTWGSSQSGVASIAGGVATGVAVGTTDVTASNGGVTSGPARLTVVAVRKGSVVLDRPWVFLTATGQSTRLTAQAFDAAGLAAAGPVTWTSSAPDKVSVDAGGQLVALGIGSAQIVAEANGVRSPPTLVVVATPHAGALLVRDDQVVSVGAPLLAASETAGVGTRYEVTLRGVAAPLPGTVVLARQMAPVHGKVVSVREDVTGMVVTLAVAPLYELLDAYDIRIRFALADFPGDGVTAKPGLGKRPVWGAGSEPLPPATAASRKLEPFKPFDCDAGLTGKLASKSLQLSVDNKLFIVAEASPGYSRRSLEGSAEVIGSAGVKLNAGFGAKASCFAQAQIKLPILGSFSALVMPAISFGLGVELEGTVQFVQAELGVTGSVGIAGSMGYECGGATLDCRALKELTRTNNFKTKSRMPTDKDPKADISAHFYVFARLDAVVLLGAGNLEIVELKFGPKQSFDMAYEKDQAALRDYASTYDLKLAGSLEPGSDLKKAIAMLINSDTTTLNFELQFGKPLSESPKGTLAISKARVRPAEMVEFVVDLDGKTVFYDLLGYNVTGVDLWRKREDEIEFTFWKFMEPTASQGTNFRYRWKPEEADAGKYEFAAFVSTLSNLPVPTLEVKTDSIKPLEVQCFSGSLPKAQGSPQLLAPGPACFDSFDGTASVVTRSPGSTITVTSNVKWTFKVENPLERVYVPTGSFDIAITAPGCTVRLSPNHFDILPEPTPRARLYIRPANQVIAANYGIIGDQAVTTTLTTSCEGKPDAVSSWTSLPITYATGSGPYTGQAVLSGVVDFPEQTNTWNFSRP